MDSLGLYDIYGYWYTPFWQTGVFKIILAVAGLFFCIGIVCFIVKKMKTNRALDLWTSWHTTLNTIRNKQLGSKKIYYILTQVLKEIAITQLNASDGSTDAELAVFFKNEAFPVEVRELGDMIDQATTYKFDPGCTGIIMQENELERVIEAIAVIKKMVQTKQ